MLDKSKLKASADIAYVSQNVNFFFDRVEVIEGKGENAGDLHFLLLSLCFSKAKWQGLLKLYCLNSVPVDENIWSKPDLIASDDHCYDLDHKVKAVVTCQE